MTNSTSPAGEAHHDVLVTADGSRLRFSRGDDSKHRPAASDADRSRSIGAASRGSSDGRRSHDGHDDDHSEHSDNEHGHGHRSAFSKLGKKLGGLFKKRRKSDASASSHEERRSMELPRSVSPAPPVPSTQTPVSILANAKASSLSLSHSSMAPPSSGGSAEAADTDAPNLRPPDISIVLHDSSSSSSFDGNESDSSSDGGNPAYIDRARQGMPELGDGSSSGLDGDSDSSDSESEHGKSLGKKVSNFLRRLSIGPNSDVGKPSRVMTEPVMQVPFYAEQAAERSPRSRYSLGVPHSIIRSRSADHRTSEESPRTAAAGQSITFDVDASTERKKRGRSVDPRRNSIFSLFSASGKEKDEEEGEQAEDGEERPRSRSRAGSIFSFTFPARKARTEGSASTSVISPWVEPPLPPLHLVGRYKDARKILDESTAEAVRKHIPRRLRESTRWPLLYSMDMHGISFSSFYLLTQNKGPTVWALQDTKGITFGVFVSEDIRMVRDGEGFYGTGECFLWEKLDDKTQAGGEEDREPEASQAATTVPGARAATPKIETDGEPESTEPVNPSSDEKPAGTLSKPVSLASVFESHVRMHPASITSDLFVATRRDLMIFGGGKHVALYIDENFTGGYSDGQTEVFELDGVPLGSEAEDASHPIGEGEEFEVALQDEKVRKFEIRGLEVWGIDMKFESSKTEEKEITAEEAQKEGKGFGRWVEGDDKWGEIS